MDLLENEGLMGKTESRYEKVLTLVLLLDLLLFLFYFCLLALEVVVAFCQPLPKRNFVATF